MKVAIVGSRYYPDMGAVVRYVENLPDGTIVVSGGAKGVDTVAVTTAMWRGLETIVIPAKWHDLTHPGRRIKFSRFGKPYDAFAGIRRNIEIVESVDMIVAFWDGKSTGTKHTIDTARKRKYKVEVHRPTKAKKKKTAQSRL